jgi:dTDP-4-amino-4,6-dideoxygalactose transaminase
MAIDQAIEDTDPLFVARPLMPELSDLTALLQEVWTSRQVTNEGPLHNRLEAALARHLEVPVAKLACNGTVALQCALLSLDLPAGSEVITTPLTFAATAHAITACGLKPVFADIDDTTLTLDPASVALAITDRSAAVLAVHVYGTICDHEGLQRLCDAHGLKLLFDAAHAFGASDRGVPVGALGDLSVFSLHATKLFNTFEGGLITSRDPDAAHRLRLARNFGIESEDVVSQVGINGKMSELNAAVGLLNLEIMGAEVAARRDLRARYDAVVDATPGLRKQVRQDDVVQSEQYYMITVDPAEYGVTREAIYNRLKTHNIFSRRYFWPVCTDFACYRDAPIASVHNLPVVERVKDRVLCLPFHSGVQTHHVETIAKVLADLGNTTAPLSVLNEAAG